MVYLMSVGRGMGVGADSAGYGMGGGGADRAGYGMGVGGQLFTGTS